MLPGETEEVRRLRGYRSKPKELVEVLSRSLMCVVYSYKVFVCWRVAEIKGNLSLTKKKKKKVIRICKREMGGC